MGILADLFVATPEAALDYHSSVDKVALHQKYEIVELRGLTGTELGVLWSILDGKEWNIETHSLKEIQFGENGETWLFLFPNSFVELLRSIDSSRMQTVLLQWVSSEEIALSGASTEDVRTILESLIKVAERSHASNKNMYLWGSV
jgi:hypothetical protein